MKLYVSGIVLKEVTHGMSVKPHVGGVMFKAGDD